jgi:hypothetical protein
MPSNWIANANIYAYAGSGIVTGSGVNTINLEFWPSNYTTRTLQALAHPIPEPSSLLLTLGGIVLLCRLARHHPRA